MISTMNSAVYMYYGLLVIQVYIVLSVVHIYQSNFQWLYCGPPGVDVKCCNKHLTG